MLLFTGFSRIASEVAGKQIQNLLARERQLKAMRRMVDEGIAVLSDEARPIAEIGRLLHQGWAMKRELAEGVTTSAIDEIYEAARSAGATGGKLLGAGGGGFMLLFAEPGRQAAIRDALRGLVHVRFRIGSPGSRVVVYEPDGLGQA
jgi:D-glycero-alpha-D-manno-heptose-7-phosphate kinase